MLRHLKKHSTEGSSTQVSGAATVVQQQQQQQQQSTTTIPIQSADAAAAVLVGHPFVQPSPSVVALSQQL